MFFILAFGIVSSVTIRKQTTPDFELNLIQVRVPYLGAAPQEVEEGVVIKIEEAIQDIPGIVEINSRAFEGQGNVTIEVATGEDINEILTEVKTKVDAISDISGAYRETGYLQAGSSDSRRISDRNRKPGCLCAKGNRDWKFVMN